MKLRVIMLFALLGLTGCVEPQIREQSDDDNERDKAPMVKTIGDLTTVANAEPVAISGVGLVVGLDGTGGVCPPGGFRSLLEDQLKKRGIPNIKDVLDSPDHAVVLVSALIPPGARKGDPLDVEITLPPQSKVTSLRGGRLEECLLFNYSSVREIAPASTHADRPLLGHALAKAEGPLLVGFGDGDEATRQRQGRIWGGARCGVDRAIYLALNPDQQFARVAMRISERINEVFQGSYKGPGTGLAEAKTKEVVYLRIPNQYKLNLPRFLRVVRLIPYQDGAGISSPYHRRLEHDLLDPMHTITAALRLEALGTDSIPALKAGLESKHALVRFAAAESLAYLGSPCCGEELAQLIKDQPVLRAYGLTALASLDEAVCHVRLSELLSQQAPEVRYGAFRALRALDEHEAAIAGELLNDCFWVHRVAQDSSPLVHMSTSRRPEIVVFGEEPFLEPPFSFLAGPEFTVTASRDDERCTISRFSLRHGTSRRQCGLKLVDVLHNLAELGGSYPDAVELLKQAERAHCLSCPVVVDALPTAVSVFDLARTGTTDPQMHQTDSEILSARGDFGATPTLFERGTKPHIPPSSGD